LIDDKLVDKYCLFSGDFNNCHLKQTKDSSKKRIIHGGLICDTSLTNNLFLKRKQINRLKITFNNLLYIPSILRTKLIKKEQLKYKFSVNSKGNEIINYETFFYEQNYPFNLDTNNFSIMNEVKRSNEWELNFKKDKIYRTRNYLEKDNFYSDSKINSIYSSSLGLLSKIVGMYVPGKYSTSLLYDIYYKKSKEPYLYLKIVNYIPSISLLRIILQTPNFQAIINAKNKSPY